MNGKIFVAYHFEPPPGDDLYAPMLMTDDSPYAPPDDRRFCGYESMKWWVWKTTPHFKWVGLQQYRRALDWRAIGAECAEDIDVAASYYDVITCKPPVGTDMNMRAQFISVHGREPWEALERVMGPNWDYTAQLIPHGGLGTMRREIFDAYMQKWEDVFQELAKTVKAPRDNSYQRRLFGFIAERFFPLYLYRLIKERPETTVMFLPLVMGAQIKL